MPQRNSQLEMETSMFVRSFPNQRFWAGTHILAFTLSTFISPSCAHQQDAMLLAVLDLVPLVLLVPLFFDLESRDLSLC